VPPKNKGGTGGDDGKAQKRRKRLEKPMDQKTLADVRLNLSPEMTIPQPMTPDSLWSAEPGVVYAQKMPFKEAFVSNDANMSPLTPSDNKQKRLTSVLRMPLGGPVNMRTRMVGGGKHRLGDTMSGVDRQHGATSHGRAIWTRSPIGCPRRRRGRTTDGPQAWL
jgi:hypothetical protein